MRITIETIQHEHQRYDTCGDWLFLGEPPTELRIRVSHLGDWRMEALVGLHEAIEALLCRQRGISEESVTAFDKAFEGDEPGEDRAAPYHREHMFAYAMELALMTELGVDFNEYDEKVNAL